jgi:hypothetical protein
VIYFKDMSDYEISKSDVEATVRYLKHYDPKNANEDYAYGFLVYLKELYREIALDDIDKLEEIRLAFEKSKS